MKFTDILTNIYYVLAIISVVGVASKLLFGWFRGDQISKRFIVDMASEHLPYIYKELRKQNPNIDEHPRIAFISFKDR